MAREPLTLDDFDKRFTREGNRLYFDGNELQTQVHLSPKQTTLAIAVAVSAILGAIATCVYTGTYIWFTLNPPHPASVQQPAAGGGTPSPPPTPSGSTPVQGDANSTKQGQDGRQLPGAKPPAPAPPKHTPLPNH